MSVEIPSWLGGIFAFLVGASLGSFVNVAAYRLPRAISIVAPRSFCPHCERPIPPWANIPIFSYLALRGRCHMCGTAIALRHFVAEASLGVAALYLFLNFPIADAGARLALCAALFTVALIDYDWRLIPNAITLPGILIGLLAASFAMPEIGTKSALIGLGVGWGFLFMTGEAYFWLRGREGVGMGDVWLLGMVGAFLGWPGALVTLFAGSFLGAAGGLLFALAGGVPKPLPVEQSAAAGQTVLGEQAAEPAARPAPSVFTTEVPFGPFLALAAGIYALFQPQLTRWYLGG